MKMDEHISGSPPSYLPACLTVRLLRSMLSPPSPKPPISIGLKPPSSPCLSCQHLCHHPLLRYSFPETPFSPASSSTLIFSSSLHVHLLEASPPSNSTDGLSQLCLWVYP
ncbi:unnamed protein product [Pleuronectes platessa]|uniref:Uncharacterized protein n=1 Tax=Pleuronectes platessa TaxID=8262 RepID=A0A9N7Z4D6_PLEPL|nr:unnamed protein product [Pleuronectes platessa]